MAAERQEDRLASDGIYKKGFGIIPKYVMRDPDLSLESKTIYAYLCALAGGGETTFPYRETILRQLKMAKNTYYAHYKPLIAQGYITVSRPADKSAANIYTLVANPKKLQETSPTGEGMLRYRGLKAHGYGSLPRTVMQDGALSVKAKGLYAYFCSYCGAGDCAFPRKDHILHQLGISEPTYYKALNQLKEHDYLRIEQRKDAGRFSINDYYLNEFPGIDTPHQNICDTKNRDIKKDKPVKQESKPVLPIPNNCDTVSCDVKKAHAKNDDPRIITEFSNNNNTSNNLSTGWDGALREMARPFAEQKVGAEHADELLDAFLPVFLKSAQNPGIRNMKAYLSAALGNFVAQSAVREQSRPARSYDLDEIARMLENPGIW